VARLGVHEYLTRHYQNRFYFRTEDVLLRQNQSQDGPRPRSREERSNFDRFAAWRASRPDVGTDLNFSEGTRPCLIADDIVIKIDEVRMEDPDPLAKLNFYHWHPQVNRQDRSDANKICLLAHDCIASCWRAKNFSMLSPVNFSAAWPPREYRDQENVQSTAFARVDCGHHVK